MNIKIATRKLPLIILSVVLGVGNLVQEHTKKLPYFIMNGKSAIVHFLIDPYFLSQLLSQEQNKL